MSVRTAGMELPTNQDERLQHTFLHNIRTE